MKQACPASRTALSGCTLARIATGPITSSSAMPASSHFASTSGVTSATGMAASSVDDLRASAIACLQAAVSVGASRMGSVVRSCATAVVAASNDVRAAPFIRTETLEYTERTAETLQLSGRHKLPVEAFGAEGALLFDAPELDIDTGRCGDVDLSGVRCAAVVHWPKAIHDGDGKCVFVVDPSTTDEQIEALSQICTGQLGGLPWELLGPTFEVVGLEKAKISIDGEGLKSVFRAEGIAEGRGDTFKNPVTGEEHLANVDLPDGFIWTHGRCGQGSFTAKAGGLSLEFENTNWILYDFDWNNAQAKAA